MQITCCYKNKMGKKKINICSVTDGADTELERERSREEKDSKRSQGPEV